MASSTTEGKLYFIEVDTKERLEIQFVPPKLTVDRSANIASVAIVGRNTPKYQYTGGETLLKFQLDFFSEEEDRTDVYTKVRWLESLMYADGYVKGPSRVQLVFGDLYKKELWTVKVCTYDLELFHKQEGYLPQQAYVDLVLALDPIKNLRIRDIRNPFRQGNNAKFLG